MEVTALSNASAEKAPTKRNEPDDHFYMLKAYQCARHSKDPSTQNGSIIVPRHPPRETTAIGGYNRFPTGVKETEARFDRSVKLSYIEHAERAAIYRCAYEGIPLEDAVMYCPWSACSECARAIIMSGIRTLVTHKERCEVVSASSEAWKKTIEIAMEMLAESGVRVRQYSGPVNSYPVRASGMLWCPKTLGFVDSA